ncbi:E3 ubiquitin-protein ligase kcmf1 [Mactra antiquata]
MHFSSGGATLTGISPSGRESMDPIAELLSQLSSVRSRAAAAQSVTSQLHQLEMQLQTTRQQLERTPRRIADAAKVTSMAGVTTTTESQGATGGGNNNNSSSNSLYLLSRCTESVIDENSVEQQNERSNRSLFVQELLLSTLTEQLNINDNSLESLEKLSDKVTSPSYSGESETDKNDSSSTEGSSTNQDRETLVAASDKSSSTEVSSQSNGDATVVSKTKGVKSLDKVGTKQKVVSSVVAAPLQSASGRGASGSQPNRGSRQIHYQSLQGERHSQAVHIRQGGLVSNSVDLSNNLSLNVARGGNGSGYDGENPQPLPGRPGSGGRDRDGRMNPPTAKRNLVKHLPATKTSDREPPPH